MKFVAFDGPNCSSKSTVIAELRNRLAKMCISSLSLNEPGGTIIGNKIRKLLAREDSDVIDFYLRTSLYMRSFAESNAVMKACRDMIEIFITDRYVASTYVYTARMDPEKMKYVGKEFKRSALITPDVYFILTMPYRTYRYRVTERGEVAMNEENYAGILRGYESIPDNITGMSTCIYINSETSIEAMVRAIIFHLANLNIIPQEG